MIKRISRTKRIKEVKDLLSEVGMNFKEDKDWNTFQVWPDGDKRGEPSTYDTLGTSNSDLEDALRSGLDIAKRLKKANPRCKTFQVKRKTGKKTIQVRRKVCNPEISYDKLDDLIGKKVEIRINNQSIVGILFKGTIYDKYKIINETGITGFSKYDIIRINKNKIYLEFLE